MIIDTHIHYYDPDRPEGVPWPPMDSPLFRRVLPDEFRANANACGISGVVIVEASEWVEDNEWLLRLVHDDPTALGIVGRLDLTDDRFPAQIERFAADPLFRGIRLNGQEMTDPMRTPQFREHVAEVARRDLALDLNVGPDLLDHMMQVAETLPDLRIVVDHMGGSSQSDGRPDSLRRETLRRLSARPNVYCKLSGFVEAASKHHDPVPQDPAYYRPAFDVLLEIMGPHRLLYASNWPVSALVAPYQTVFHVLEAWVEGLDAVTRGAVQQGNAVRAYRLNPEAAGA